MSRGPVFTLLAVLALGVALLGINVAAQEPSPAPAGVAAPAAASAPAAPPPSTATATPDAQPATAPAAPADTPAAPFPPKAKYVGDADTAAGPVPVAVTIDGDRAKVYVCDGKKIEAWLQGTARDGVVEATGKRGARLSARHEGDHLTGTVALPGRPEWTFTTKATTNKKAGVYRARSGGRTSGWVVGDDGRYQVGLSHDATGAVVPAMPLALDTPLPPDTAPVDAATDVLAD